VARVRSISPLLDERDGLTVDALVATLKGAAAGQSGFKLLTLGGEAFLALAVLAARAQRTLDLQYYIFRADTTGSLLSAIVLRAADRGVRVRMLVDGFNLIGRDYQAAVLNTHPNVELRLFNPLAGHAGGPFRRLLGLVTEPERANRRMHNKVFIADGRLVVLGGRNVGDRYFGASDEVGFGDMDVLCAGAVVADICASFDGFWRNRAAKTLQSVGIKSRSMAEFGRFRHRISHLRKRQRDSAFAMRLADTKLAQELTEASLDLTWASARLIVDLPDKVAGIRQERFSPLDQLTELAKGAKRELLLVSPYFIPGDRGMSLLAALRARGIKIRLISNSLASTDVIAVHAAYRRYRYALLKIGVEIYELRSLPSQAGKRKELFASSRASLHAKVYVLDQARAVIGSLNLDPRSMFLNTEIGVLIHSVVLAGELADHFDLLVSPDYSYRVCLQDGSEKVMWMDRQDEITTEFFREPGASLWRRLGAFVFQWLPIEDQL
jgi:putative cardiolipin synthase